MLEAQNAIAEIRKFLGQVYNETGGQKEDIKSLTDAEILELASNLKHGVPMATPVFDGASEEEIKSLLALAELPTLAVRPSCTTDARASSSTGR